MQRGAEGTPTNRRSGGLRAVRPGVWRVDVELPREHGEPRRRVSRTVEGSQADAESLLEALRQEVLDGGSAAKRAARKSGRQGRRRQRGSGGITSRGHDRWLVSLEGPPDPITGDRQRLTKVVYGHRTAAENELALMRVRLRAGNLTTGTRAHDVRAACDVYLDKVGTERSTVRVDRSACNRICDTKVVGGRTLGKVQLREVDWQLVEYVFSVWARTLKPSTSARYASTLSKVLEHAKRENWISSNPVREARKPKVPSRRPDVPERPDVSVALATARKTDPATYAFVLGVASMGCRRSELLALRLGDLDLDRRVVTIRGAIADGGPGTRVYYKATKRDDWRDVPITDQFADALRELLLDRRAQGGGDITEQPEAFVFSDSVDGSTWWRPDTTTQRWLKARRTSKVTFAMLRRFVATELLDVTDGDYRTVASITGNSEETLRRWYDAGPNLSKKKAVLSRANL
jgi:integrase